MCPGFSTDLTNIDDVRKTAVIDAELNRLNIDIAGLQETRLAEEGSLRENNYTFFWKGRGQAEKRQHGVGFAVKNSLLGMIEIPAGGNERLLSLRLATSCGFATIITAYAPTLDSSDDVKDSFYEELDSVIKAVPKSDYIYMLGDFNARVGKDSSSWPVSIGKYNIGRMNENGQRLLEHCTSNDL